MRGRVGKRELDKLLLQAKETGQPVYLFDDAVKGFIARVAPSGSVSFSFEYCLGGRGGRNQRMQIGRMGDLTPDQARRKAQTLRGQVLEGIDVAAQKKDQREQHKKAPSFAEVAENYLSLNGRGNVSWGETRRLIEHDALPVLGRRPAGSIKRAHIASLMDDIAQRAPATARSVFAALRPLFRWAFERGLIEVNPCDGLRAPPSPKARDRVLTTDEIRALWRASEIFGYPFGPMWQLLLLTGQRREEVAGARWEEFDLEGRLWQIPGRLLDGEGRKLRGTKNTSSHVLDLSPQAVSILASCPRCTSPFIFTTTGDTAISGFSKAKARLDTMMSKQLEKTLLPWRNHDIRRTVATGMAEQLGVDEGVIERILNHRPQGIKAVYQRQEYRERRRSALTEWGAYIAEITSQEDGAG